MKGNEKALHQFPQPPFSLLGPDILLRSPFLNMLNLCVFCLAGRLAKFNTYIYNYIICSRIVRFEDYYVEYNYRCLYYIYPIHVKESLSAMLLEGCVLFIYLGAGYTQQAHPREIPEAER